MGGNLFFAGTGAVLETVGVEIDDALLSGWRTRVERARRHLGWDRSTPGSPLAPAIVARRHATGMSLALQAPVDQLFTATELNEWALCATVFERDPVRWASVAADLLADYLEDANDPAEVIPPVLEAILVIQVGEIMTGATLSFQPTFSPRKFWSELAGDVPNKETSMLKSAK